MNLLPRFQVSGTPSPYAFQFCLLFRCRLSLIALFLCNSPSCSSRLADVLEHSRAPEISLSRFLLSLSLSLSLSLFNLYASGLARTRLLLLPDNLEFTHEHEYADSRLNFEKVGQDIFSHGSEMCINRRAR